MRRFNANAAVGVDVLVANDVLQMPLHSVNPAFLREFGGDGRVGEGVV